MLFPHFINVLCFYRRFEGDSPEQQSDLSATKLSHLERLLSKIEDKKIQAQRLAREEKEREERRREKKNRKTVAVDKSVSKKVGKQPVSTPQKNEKKRVKPMRGAPSDFDGKFTVIGSDSLHSKKQKVSPIGPFLNYFTALIFHYYYLVYERSSIIFW